MKLLTGTQMSPGHGDGCHRHTPANVKSGHENGNLAALLNCIRCHAGGKGGGD